LGKPNGSPAATRGQCCDKILHDLCTSHFHWLGILAVTIALIWADHRMPFALLALLFVWALGS